MHEKDDVTYSYVELELERLTIVTESSSPEMIPNATTKYYSTTVLHLTLHIRIAGISSSRIRVPNSCHLAKVDSGQPARVYKLLPPKL